MTVIKEINHAMNNLCFRLLPFVKGNVGFVFTNGDLKEVRDKLLENKVDCVCVCVLVSERQVTCVC